MMEDRIDSAGKPERPPPQSRSSAARVRLSCEACRQRKVRCDKLSPCTSCVRLGFVCVPVERPRLPRGRTRRPVEQAAHTDKELVDRVVKLENLLRQVATERDARPDKVEETSPGKGTGTGTGAGSGHTERSFASNMADIESWRSQQAQPSTTMTLPHRPRPATTYLASSFWEDIMQQTAELRTVLDDRLEIDQEVKPSCGIGGISFLSSESSCSPKSPSSDSGVNLTPQARRSLCEIYLRNVDPVFKILHRPSIQAFLRDDEPYLDYETDHQVPVTLANAIYYAAVCTMSDPQCQSLFGVDKRTISSDLQKETEAALVKADFVTTNDISVLQAYVLSLVAARCQDQSRRVWTMLAMALRTGQALCLHMNDPPFYVSPFEREMRRRLWQAIGLLDLAASLDRASEPMMQSAWLDYLLPANVNDDDIHFDMETPIHEPPEGTFTDMTLSLILCSAQSVARMLAFRDFIEPGKKTMALRHEVLSGFEKRATSLLSGCRPDLFAFQLYTKRTAAIINGFLQLGCLRPLQRTQNFIPPQVPGDSLLQLAADNLLKLHETYSDPATDPWMWFGTLWVPWHGLAVALAELCVCKDPAILAKYWPVVELVFHKSSFTVADSQNGMLWKPLEKLMNQAKAHKKELLGHVQFPAEAAPQSRHDMMPMSELSNVHLTSEQLTAQLTPEDLNSQFANPAYTTGFETNMASQPIHPTLVPQSNMLPDMLGPYPSLWDSMDFSNTQLPAPDDNIAWHNYETFIGDVYDGVNYFHPH